MLKSDDYLNILLQNFEKYYLTIITSSQINYYNNDVAMHANIFYKVFLIKSVTAVFRS